MQNKYFQKKHLQHSCLKSLWVLIVVTMVSPVLAQGKVASEPLSVNFGDFQAKAELTYPARGRGPFPTVVLIPGSGPEDMNASISSFGADGKPVFLSSIFKQLSDYLSEHGFAVLRYNKHYVTGPGQADFQKFYTQLDLPQMLTDAGKVLAKAEANPKVDKKQIFLYGWSEGSTVAAALAAKHPELAGLIVQGPVTEPWREVFRYQVFKVGLPYLRQFSPDEQVTVKTLKELQAGDGGLVAKGILLNYLEDGSSFQTGVLKVNTALDTNEDGTLQKNELTGNAFDKLLDDYLGPQGFGSIYAARRALPDVREQGPNLNLPILILQGENDANVPPSGARALNTKLGRVGNAEHTLELYPGLGHTLGETPSVIKDDFQPMAQRPLKDVVAWLETHSNTHSSK